MRTIDEIINSSAEPWIISIENEDSIETWDREEIRDMMKEYAAIIINEIMEAEHQHNLYNGTTVNAVASEWINRIKEQIL